jgi:hypothetical protein
MLYDSDWPDFDLWTAFTQDAETVRRWAAHSPRRSISPDGRRLLAIRRRRGGEPGVFATNLPPTDGTPGIESLDLVTRKAAVRVLLPPGVAVKSVRAHDDERSTLVFALDETVQRALDCEPELEVVLHDSVLTGLPEPPIGELLDAFALLLASALPTAPAVAARAEAFVTAQRVAARERARLDTALIARARQDAHLKIRDLPFSIVRATVRGELRGQGGLRWFIDVTAEGAGPNDAVWRPNLSTDLGGLPHPAEAPRRLTCLAWHDQSAYDKVADEWLGSFSLFEHGSFDHCSIDIARDGASGWTIVWSGQCDLDFDERYGKGVPFSLRSPIDMVGIDVDTSDVDGATKRLLAHVDLDDFDPRPLPVKGNGHRFLWR